MRYKFLVLFIVVMLVPVSALAEFYKYRDSNGVLRFTYNLGDVPEDQRPNAKSYVEVKSASPKKEDPETVARKKEEAEVKVRKQVNTRAEAFNARQNELRKEYEALLKEKRTLDKQLTKRATAAEAKRYKKQVEALNARIDAYQEKRAAYEKEVEEYNKKVSRLNTQK